MDFFILGPLEARVDGRGLPLGGAQQRALLALLLLHRNEVVSTDRLIDGLWGATPPPTAAKVVQVYVSRLRRLLGQSGAGAGRLITRPPGYTLELHPGELDLDRFERRVDEARRASAEGDPAAASAALHEGLAMWRGPPLADLTFEPFAQPAALRLEEQRMAALEDRVEADLALGRAPELVGELGALVREHPYRERLRAHLMLALYRSGRQAEALAAYRDARRALVDELGIEPSPGLADLERAILRHDPTLAAPSATAAAPAPQAPIAGQAPSAAVARATARPPAAALSPAIVGRGPALARIDGALDGSASSVTVLRIVGDAGLGKTRLAQEAAARARARGRLVLEGRATPTDAASTLGVFSDLVRADRRTRADADRPADPLAASLPSWLLPELGAPPGEGEPDRGVLFEAASRYFRALTRPTGLVMVLEDLHLADPASHDLVHYLARTSADEPLLLLLTYRPHDPPASLSRLVHELVRDRLGDEVVLPPLDEGAVGELVTGLTGRSPDGSTLATIAAMSDGNPFAVEEVVRAALDEGQLDPSGRLRAGDALELPHTVHEMLLARVGRLRPGDRELLRWVSVAGESVDLRLLTAVSEGSEDEVLAGLDRLGAAGLVTDEPGGGSGRRVALRRPEIRDAAAGELLEPERRRRHARLLEAAESLSAGAGDTPVEELVGHALAAGDRARAFRYSVQAARRCLGLGGYGGARDHFARARDLWEPSDGLEARAELLLAYGRLLVRVTHDPEAVTVLDQAREAFEALGYRAGATAARAAAAEARYNLGEAARALADARALASEVGPEGAPEARLLAMLTLARLLSLRGEVVEAGEVAGAGLALVSGAPSRPQAIARARLLNVLGGATWLRGDPAAGATAMLESARLAGEVGDPVGAVRAYTNLALSGTWYGCGPIEAAAGWADAGLAIASAHGLLPAEAWLAAVRAAACLEAGEDEEVAPLLERAERAQAGAGPVPHVALALRIARAERLLSERALDEAAEAFAAAMVQADDLGHPGSSWLVRDGLARARLAADDAPGAGAAVAPAMAALRARPALLRSFAWLATRAVEVAAALGGGEAADVAGWLRRDAPGALARYADALAGPAAAAPSRAKEVEAAARAMEEAGRRSTAARMRLTGATTLAREGGGDPAAGLGAAAHSSFRALGREGWCRAAEELLLGLGRPVPVRDTGAGATG